jgi:hypothetical protein
VKSLFRQAGNQCNAQNLPTGWQRLSAHFRRPYSIRDIGHGRERIVRTRGWTTVHGGVRSEGWGKRHRSQCDMRKPPRELLEFLHRYDPAIQSLALGLRQVIHDEMSPCHEYIFEMRSKVVLLYGSTERVISDGICNIGVFRRHVTIGFARGTDLEDRGGVLEGTGKSMRHIRLTRLSDLDRPEIRQYLRKARRAAGLKRSRHPAAEEVVTRVKQKSAARRPSWLQLW